MKAYLVDAGFHTVIVDYLEEWPIYSEEGFIDIVFAESRGQARAIAAWEWDFDFTEKMSIKLLPGEWDFPKGMLPEWYEKDWKPEYEELWKRAWHIAALKDKNNKEIVCTECNGLGCEVCYQGKLVVDISFLDER